MFYLYHASSICCIFLRCKKKTIKLLLKNQVTDGHRPSSATWTRGMEWSRKAARIYQKLQHTAAAFMDFMASCKWIWQKYVFGNGLLQNQKHDINISAFLTRGQQIMSNSVGKALSHLIHAWWKSMRCRVPGDTWCASTRIGYVRTWYEHNS